MRVPKHIKELMREIPPSRWGHLQGLIAARLREGLEELETSSKGRGKIEGAKSAEQVMLMVQQLRLMAQQEQEVACRIVTALAAGKPQESGVTIEFAPEPEEKK